MSSKYKFHDQSSLYFVTGTVVKWIDLFTRNEYRDEIVKSIKHCQKEKGLEVYAWVIMTNHFHMIAGSPKGNLSEIMRDMKTHTSKKLKIILESHSHESRKDWLLWMMQREGNRLAHHRGWQLWQEGVHPVECYNREVFYQKLEYIHLNPVKAGFVFNAEDWVYSSAIGYSNNSGMIELSYI